MKVSGHLHALCCFAPSTHEIGDLARLRGNTVVVNKLTFFLNLPNKISVLVGQHILL